RAGLPRARALPRGGGRRAPPRVLAPLPPFSLTERHGTTVSAGDLAGRVWVADFVFTRCPDICPVLSTRMASLQETLNGKLAAGDVPVRLVSISVDPLRDTPEALAAYADHYHAGPDRLFLTGSRHPLPRPPPARLPRAVSDH